MVALRGGPDYGGFERSIGGLGQQLVAGQEFAARRRLRREDEDRARLRALTDRDTAFARGLVGQQMQLGLNPSVGLRADAGLGDQFLPPPLARDNNALGATPPPPFARPPGTLAAAFPPGSYDEAQGALPLVPLGRIRELVPPSMPEVPPDGPDDLARLAQEYGRRRGLAEFGQAAGLAGQIQPMPAPEMMPGGMGPPLPRGLALEQQDEAAAQAAGGIGAMYGIAPPDLAPFVRRGDLPQATLLDRQANFERAQDERERHNRKMEAARQHDAAARLYEMERSERIQRIEQFTDDVNQRLAQAEARREREKEELRYKLDLAKQRGLDDEAHRLQQQLTLKGQPIEMDYQIPGTERTMRASRLNAAEVAREIVDTLKPSGGRSRRISVHGVQPAPGQSTGEALRSAVADVEAAASGAAAGAAAKQRMPTPAEFAAKVAEYEAQNMNEDDAIVAARQFFGR